ncbi:MAG TPA: hypothetical protein PKA16_04235 [Ottowia sp.]|uniref:hypothetical protein n=1 Tax=Ottowia sp. TaxID=1898956 RepID=UPI002CB6FD3F|nr:hypothetical protein [Ottowia sp.]HMN20584.1 hypothetical protein [Ottowia sp.]
MQHRERVARRTTALAACVAWWAALPIVQGDHPDARKAQRLRWEADRLDVIAGAQNGHRAWQKANRLAAHLLRQGALALVMVKDREGVQP